MTNVAVQRRVQDYRLLQDMFMTLSLDNSTTDHLRALIAGWIAQKEITEGHSCAETELQVVVS